MIDLRNLKPNGEVLLSAETLRKLATDAIGMPVADDRGVVVGHIGSTTVVSSEDGDKLYAQIDYMGGRCAEVLLMERTPCIQ